MPKKVHLLVGTHKGAFILSSDLKRKNWTMKGPLLKGADVNHMILDTRGKPTLYAAANSYWWGPNVHISNDLGKTWKPSEGGVRFEENRGKKVERVWNVWPGHKSQPNVLYAGVDPGALFRSEDGGKNWSEVKGLTDHPTREKWNPGAGGMMVHSFAQDPVKPNKFYVGISAAGTFVTEDGGKSWEPRNKGVRADFNPDKYPEVGQCVHHLEMHPAKPDVLYQQNHCGQYRSDNGGKDWVDINKGLPSRFGFPLAIHPHNPDTVYVIPEEGAEFRAPVKGKFAIYRSKNRGVKWQALIKGLPKKDVYVHVHRHAMAVDTCDSAGIYVGTSGGHIFYSRNDGDSWEEMVSWGAPVFSLSAAVV
jgi:photosystem II stability/assembly factor-like uncharacterized protein